MFTIKPAREHFEVYLDGSFFCSADTESEAEREIKEHEREMKINENFDLKL